MSKIGRITIKGEDLFDFKLKLNGLTKEYEVLGRDGHRWGAGKTTKGALISACNCGVRLNKIDISEAYVPIQEVINIIKQS